MDVKLGYRRPGYPRGRGWSYEIVRNATVEQVTEIVAEYLKLGYTGVSVNVKKA